MKKTLGYTELGGVFCYVILREDRYYNQRGIKDRFFQLEFIISSFRKVVKEKSRIDQFSILVFDVESDPSYKYSKTINVE